MGDKRIVSDKVEYHLFLWPGSMHCYVEYGTQEEAQAKADEHGGNFTIKKYRIKITEEVVSERDKKNNGQ